MRLSLLWIGFMIVATIVMPPDAISQLTVAVLMAIIYGLTSLALSRLRLLPDTAPLTKTVLIFLFSVALALLVLFGL
jgi:Sec-independent protein secretion pathway component TatC